MSLLEELLTEGSVQLNWVSLVAGKSGVFELHVKPMFVNFDSLKRIVQNRKLATKEINGVIVIYKPYNVT